MKSNGQAIQAGFTLIELLIVIAIIGILSSVIVVSLSDARVKAQDAKKLLLVNQLSRALELYYDDNNHYPPYRAYPPDPWSDPCGRQWCVFQADLASYIPLPLDPVPVDGFLIGYESNSGDNFQTYGLMVSLKHISNYQLMVKDVGSYFDGVLNGAFYEFGSQPEYCSSKYSGQNSNWFNDNGAVAPGSSPFVCQGGN
jgi:prepilin-type N-terminal cleavage/methylation domain-containing protein